MWRAVEILAFAEFFFFFCLILVHVHCTCGVGTKLLNLLFYLPGSKLCWLFSWRREAIPYIWSWWQTCENMGLPGWFVSYFSWLEFVKMFINMFSTCLLENQRNVLLWLESGTFRIFAWFVYLFIYDELIKTYSVLIL